MSAREELVRAELLNEMVAEGLVKFTDDAVPMLVHDGHEFMVEVRVLEVTGYRAIV